jgi:hypothetical protein
MEINCEQVVQKYLLNQNPFYAFSFPLAILISIIVFGVAKAYNVSNNSYINQILIPILAFLLTMVFIDIIARMMISKKELTRLTNQCKLWMHDPAIKNHPILSKMIDMSLVENYGVESFTSGAPIIRNNLSEEDDREQVRNKILQERKNISVENIEIPYDSIAGFFPETIPSKPENLECVGGSNSYSFCAGSNPKNLVAPIPGPQWLVRSAEAVQNSLKNNQYTKATC